MVTTQARRLGILIALMLVMAATRIHLSLLHHSVMDASWAVFFLAGFWLGGAGSAASRYGIFALLMAEAVVLDYLVISGQGIDFWSHYCVSIAYWFLVPAYLALWMGGSLLRTAYRGLRVREVALLAAALVVSLSVSYLLFNGSYYWLSDTWMDAGKVRSFGGWIENLGDWYLPYLRTSAMYVAVAAALHVGVTLAVRSVQGAAAPVRPARG